jgi:uncharacterized protein
MSNDFLGVGWNFPLQPNINGQVQMARYEESVRQSIWLILGTTPGERLMRPDFGCGIHTQVFATNSAGTAGQIISDARDALLKWEPRIDVLDITAIPDETQPNLILIEIEYRVRTTNNRFNLVYPFYLE